MRTPPRNFLTILSLASLALALAVVPRAAHAQTAEEIVHKVVGNELWYGQHDHSEWMYRDDYKSPSKNQVKLVVETSQGNLSEIIEDYGRTPSPQVHQADVARINRMVYDPSFRAQLRKNEQHDSDQASSLLKMLPDAFVWKIEGREHGEIRLSYHPNPDFSPSSMASRVLAAMSGTMTVDEEQMRLEDLRGKLTQPVVFGWGLLGRINAGGTFEVLRTEIGPQEWQITQTHVHINGHALFFKNIGDQEDEVTLDYHPSPAGLDLEKAKALLLSGEVAKSLDVRDPFAP